MSQGRLPSRRDILQIGGAGMLGLTLPELLRQKAGADTNFRPTVPQIKSFVLVVLEGGLSHIDSFDVKPEAPDTVKSDFDTISTALPGVHFSEHIPQLAARADKFALVRSMSHADPGHPSATHKLITGATLPNLPENVGIDKHAGRDDFPCYAAGMSKFRPDLSHDTLGGVHLPSFISGAFNWPGQNAGFLGPRHDPLQLYKNSDDFDYSQDSFRLREGITVGRIQSRSGLLREFDNQRRDLGHHLSTRAFSDHQERAFATLDSPKLADAFDIDSETPALRERYGQNAFGQGLILARRLVGAGIPVIQTNLRGWDTHVDGFAKLKGDLLPKFDAALSTFIDDMQEHGLLEETLVVVTGEFGRTPLIKIEPGYEKPGRDHWPHVYSALFLGGGVQTGQVIGASNRMGAFPDSDAYTPYDLGSTVYQAFGVDPTYEIHDVVRHRTFPLSRGKVIRPLYSS